MFDATYKATRDTYYNGRAYKEGERFTVDSRDDHPRLPCGECVRVSEFDLYQEKERGK